jgi:hypothetical protein
MGDIRRYRMTNSFGHQDNVNGGWVRYEDHTVAVEAAVLAENIRLGGIVKQHHEIADAVTPPTTCGCPGGYAKKAKAPTPAELIPTLKEHEWVWFKALSGKWEGPYAIYPNSSHDSILLSAGGYSLLFSDGTTSTAITEIKRCEAPEVK